MLHWRAAAHRLEIPGLQFEIPPCLAVRIVDEHQWSPTSYESFISPRSSHGVLIQLGSGYPTLNSDPAWTTKKTARTRKTA